MSSEITRFKGRNEIQQIIDTTLADSDGDSYPNTVLANVGLDVVATSGTDTLYIGAANADVVTIGKAGGTVNILGSTMYEQVTNSQVADKLITLNKGGAVSSGTGSGLEVEENSVIKGYVKTSSDRNSFQILAPNTAGIVTITPGSGGFTLDQASHNPVTLGAVGSAPANAGASLSAQVLTLQPADATHPGVVTALAQTIAGIKTFTSPALIGVMTEAARDLLTPAEGMIIYNTTSHKHQGYNGSTWNDFF